MIVLATVFLVSFFGLMIYKWWIGPPPNKKGEPVKAPPEGR